MANLTYEDYKRRLSIEDVLRDAGYVRNRRDGLRYPSYVKVDVDGRRIRGDKFIVTQNGQCCFHPPIQRTYNIISLIKEFPDMFPEYSIGMNTDLLVNKVCCRLLNTTFQNNDTIVKDAERIAKPFDISNYQLTHFDATDKESWKKFYPYFKHRGININTQIAFCDHFVLSEHESKAAKGMMMRNLSFPLLIPKNEEKIIVGFEERGRLRRDGEKSYKGKAEGSNGSEGLWIASPNKTELKETKRIFVFESAYDAMAYFQLNQKGDKKLKDAVFVSTGGNPTLNQMKGLIDSSPETKFHICFDNDSAGIQFTDNFRNVAKMCKKENAIERELPKEGFKDWNDELLAEISNDEKQKKIVGGDIDGDGEIEINESEEEKHHYHR